MSDRSTFNLAFNDIVPEAWTDGIAAHIVSSATVDDASVQGQLSANTTKGRFVTHNGSAVRDLLAYKTSGSMGYQAAQIAVDLGSYSAPSGSTVKLQWNTSGTGVNLDSHGFDRSDPFDVSPPLKNILSIPSDLPGWYSFHAEVAFAGSWGHGTADYLQLNVSGRIGQLATQTGIAGAFSASWGSMWLTAGTTLELYLRQTSGSAQSLTGAGYVELKWHGF